MNDIAHNDFVFAVVVITILFFMLASFSLSFSLLYKKRKKEHSQEKQLMQNHFQQELLKTRLEIQEETFRNISQEIHDNIGQALSFVKLNLNTVDAYNAENVKEKLNESKELLSKSIHDLRDIARSLNPDFLNEIGLANAIE